MVSVENINVGDTFSYGEYEQDKNKSNGAEKIEWLVLAKENDSILLISKYALDCQAFCCDETGTSWKDSFLRNWLNTEFMQNAFNDTEKSSIITTEIQSEENNEEIIKDKVFVLDNDEAEKYFESDISRRCSLTAYAKQRGTLCPENELIDTMNELTEKKKTVGIMIAKIDNLELRLVLEYRYLCNMTFESVASKMHYSIKWVQKKHEMALAEFERVNSI